MLKKVEKPMEDDVLKGMVSITIDVFKTIKEYNDKIKKLYTEVEKFKSIEEKLFFLNKEKQKNINEQIKIKSEFYNENTGIPFKDLFKEFDEEVLTLHKEYDKNISELIKQYEPLLENEKKENEKNMNTLSVDEMIASGIIDRAIENDKFYLSEKKKRLEKLGKLKTSYEKCEYLMSEYKKIISLEEQHQIDLLKHTTADERTSGINVMSAVLARMKNEVQDSMKQYEPLASIEVASNKQTVAQEILKQKNISEKNKYGINWNGKDAEFLEWIYATIESGVLKGYGKKEDVINAFAKFLGIEIKNPFQTLNGIKTKRNNDNRTIFLDKIK